MNRVVALNEVMSAGVVLSVGEGRAVVQQLLATDASVLQAGAPQAQPVIPEHVVLGWDGSVSLREDVALGSERDVGTFIDHLLQGAGNIPGRLRWTLARAAGRVDAPPFGSLSALSEALGRFESGDRRQIVQTLLQRSIASAPTACVAVVRPVSDLRRNKRARPNRSQLHRRLREAHRQLDDLQQRVSALESAVAVTRGDPRRSQGGSLRRAALCVAVILASGVLGWLSTSHHVLQRIVARESSLQRHQGVVQAEQVASVLAVPTPPASAAGDRDQAVQGFDPVVTSRDDDPGADRR